MGLLNFLLSKVVDMYILMLFLFCFYYICIFICYYRFEWGWGVGVRGYDLLVFCGLLGVMLEGGVVVYVVWVLFVYILGFILWEWFVF